MDFKDWYNKELSNDKRSAVYIAGAKRGFEAGRQSRQTEIDALKDCITELVKQKNKANAKLDNIQEIIELKTSGVLHLF